MQMLMARAAAARWTPPVSFMKRAREAAEAVAEQAQLAAEAARGKASEAAAVATRTAQDPKTQEKLGRQAREAMGMARRGINTVVERIDPGVLLVERLADPGEAVIALDGTTLDSQEIVEVRAALADEVTSELKLG